MEPQPTLTETLWTKHLKRSTVHSSAWRWAAKQAVDVCSLQGHWGAVTPTETLWVGHWDAVPLRLSVH